MVDVPVDMPSVDTRARVHLHGNAPEEATSSKNGGKDRRHRPRCCYSSSLHTLVEAECHTALYVRCNVRGGAVCAPRRHLGSEGLDKVVLEIVAVICPRAHGKP